MMNDGLGCCLRLPPQKASSPLTFSRLFRPGTRLLAREIQNFMMDVTTDELWANEMHRGQ